MFETIMTCEEKIWQDLRHRLMDTELQVGEQIVLCVVGVIGVTAIIPYITLS